MGKGMVVQICICPVAGAPMQLVKQVRALTGTGLEGDRYSKGIGSFSEGIIGKRQVTLMNDKVVANSGFEFPECRRNLLVHGVELMRLWKSNEKKSMFRVGESLMRAVEYCYPCDRPTKLLEKPQSFKETFYERGGIIAEVVRGGEIRIGDQVVPYWEMTEEEKDQLLT